MKKTLIIISVLLFTIVIGLAVAWEAFSYKTVQFELNSKDYSVDIVTPEGKKVESISQTAEVKLKEGDYNYKVIGEKFSDKGIKFTVKGNDTFVEVDPPYSDEYLSDLLKEERSDIEAIIKSTYKGQPTYSIQTIKLYQRGEWAAGTLQTTTDPRQIPDNYRVVLQKVNDIWTIIVPPQIAINKAEHKNVPESILYALYSNL